LQRQQMLGNALGMQQGYLGAGLGLGDVALSLYNQQQNQLRASQGAALGYLGSGQTPYQAGAGYLNTAEQRAAMAAQGGPTYNPSSLGQQYTGAGAPSFPQYGLDMSQLAGNWYNNINQANLQAYGLGQAYGQKSGGSAMGAGIGAIGGAASGALAGSAVPGIGTLLGAGIGALGGAASGYFK
jgi:phage tail tape-measure protein